MERQQLEAANMREYLEKQDQRSMIPQKIIMHGSVVMEQMIISKKTLRGLISNVIKAVGKGKGDPVGYVFPITPGRIIFEVEGVSYEIAKEALRLAAQKLPVTTKFIVRRDYDKNA